MAKRFADPGISLPQLETEFMVHCPRCEGRALVRQDRLVCMVCRQVEEAGRWYGGVHAYVSVKCRECHEPIRQTVEGEGHAGRVAVVCGHCGDKCLYDASITYERMHRGRMTDPVFGLPLFYQRAFREDILWAYNQAHLEILRDYIAADLRERGIEPRNTIKKNTSMTSRLPAFIKKASNREELLQIIDRWLAG